MTLTISIVLYKNKIDVLTKTVRSVLSSSISLKLFLVDNSPTDYFKNIFNDNRIEYIHNPSNPGFGAAHNIILKKSIENNTTYHLVLNPDVYFSVGTLEGIIDFMNKHSDVGNLMPMVCYPDGSIQYLCKLLPTPYDWIGRRFNPIKKIVENRNNKFELRFTNYDKLMEVPYLSGCFMFLRIDALRETGLFDEGIFMYGEETDLCRRLITKHFKTIYFPKVKVFHEFEKGSHKSFRLTWIGIKSAIYYFNKWGWIFDSQRVKINSDSLRKLGYNK